MSTLSALGTNVCSVGSSSQSGSLYWTPRDVVVTVIEGGIRITWLVRNNTLETEVWIKQDLGTLTLITTTGLGIETYDYICDSEHDYTVELRAKLDQTVLGVPTGFTATDNLDGTVILACNAVTGADHYVWSADISGAGHSVIATTISPTYTHSLGYTTEAKYKVRAKEGTLPVYSDYTSEIDITTAAYDYSAAASALFARMLAADGVAQTDERKTAIDICIRSLVTASLWDTQWDVLVVTRGKGANSCLLNWIKNANNGSPEGSPLYIEDVGYKKDSTYGIINTNYNLSTQSSRYTQNDACFILKESGTIGTSSKFHGAIDAGANGLDMCDAVNKNRMNGVGVITGPAYTSGWNALIRTSSTAGTFIHDSSETPWTGNTSSPMPSLNPYIFRLNYTSLFDVNVLEVNEVYAFGKSLTLSQFETFQTIMNTYFASL